MRSPSTVTTDSSVSTTRRIVVRILVLLAAMSLPGGCATTSEIAQPPLGSYHDAIVSVTSQSEAALQTEYEWSLDRFKREAGRGDVTALSQLQLEFPKDSAFAWGYRKDGGAVFLAVAGSRRRLAAINDLLVDYAGLLTQLVGADDQSQFEPEDEASRFKESAESLASTLGAAPDDQGLSLFSTVAANAASAYLEDKRSDLLVEVLEAGMEPLEKLVGHVQTALMISAGGITSEYQTEFDRLKQEFKDAGDDGRRRVILDLIDLNRKTTAQLDLLRSISRTYGTLPETQHQLIAAIREERQPALKGLLTAAQDIQRQYEHLRNEPKGE